MTDNTVQTLFIDGQWVAASNHATRTVYCPADGTEVGVVSEATTEDTERAILAARTSFESGVWADRPAIERGDFLLDVAEALREAMEPAGYVVALNGEMWEQNTGLYRVSFTVEFWQDRQSS